MTKRRLSKGGKIAILSVAVLLVVLALLYIVLDICRCFNYSALYSESQHIERVSKRVEKYFMTEESGYTNYTVYPLYDEHDKLRYFLVEFEPYGFVYIILDEIKSVIMSANSMYMYDALFQYNQNKPWRRYRLFDHPVFKNHDGEWEEIEKCPVEGWKYDGTGGSMDYHYRHWEVNANGEFVYHMRNHFKVANIKGERMYLLDVQGLYVPAVKRGDKWLNLVSLEEFVLDDYLAVYHYPYAEISLSFKHRTFLW